MFVKSALRTLFSRSFVLIALFWGAMPTSFAANRIHPDCSLELEGDTLLLPDGRQMSLTEFEASLRPMPRFFGADPDPLRPRYATDEGLLGEQETLVTAIAEGMAQLSLAGGQLDLLRNRITLIRDQLKNGDSRVVVHTSQGPTTDITTDDNVHLRVTQLVYMSTFYSPFHEKVAEIVMYTVENLSTGEVVAITPLLNHFLEFGFFRGQDPSSRQYPKVRQVDPVRLWRVLFSSGPVRENTTELSELVRKDKADQDAAMRASIEAFMNRKLQ